MYHFNIFAVPYFISTLYVLAMGFSVYEMNSPSALNISFLVQCVMTAIWQAGVFLELLSADAELALFWNRFAYMGIILVCVAAYAFIINFLGFKKQRKFVKWGYIGMGFVFFPLLGGNYLLNGLYKYSWGYCFRAGRIHLLFINVFFLWMLLNLVNLYLGIRKSKTEDEKKLPRMLFCAYLVSYLSIFDFLPGYGVDIYPYGFIPVIIYLSIFAYAMIRELSDIM